MKNQSRKMIGLAIGSFILFLTLSSCETWREDCKGDIVVENPIPDTTLYVGGEPFERDLFAQPIVLCQTEDQSVVTTFLVEDISIIKVTRQRSTTTERLNALKIVPLKEGNTTVQIIADDGCKQIETSFTVTVADTTN